MPTEKYLLESYLPSTNRIEDYCGVSASPVHGGKSDDAQPAAISLRRGSPARLPDVISVYCGLSTRSQPQDQP